MIRKKRDQKSNGGQGGASLFELATSPFLVIFSSHHRLPLCIGSKVKAIENVECNLMMNEKRKEEEKEKERKVRGQSEAEMEREPPRGSQRDETLKLS